MLGNKDRQSRHLPPYYTYTLCDKLKTTKNICLARNQAPLLAPIESDHALIVPCLEPLNCILPRSDYLPVWREFLECLEVAICSTAQTKVVSVFILGARS